MLNINFLVVVVNMFSSEEEEYADSQDKQVDSVHCSEEHSRPPRKEAWRNLVAFWFLGLCNNFGYVVMLSAAYDILDKQQNNNPSSPTATTTTPATSALPLTTTSSTSPDSGFHCNKISTGLVLLADILPTLIIKTTAPFYMQRINYHVRVFFSIGLLAASLLTVAYSPNVGVSILGVVFASISSGVGEITFLAYSSYYRKSTISAWSSGTGMAGITGALAYAGLTQVGFTAHQTLLLLLVVPLIWAIDFWVLLKMPPQYAITCQSNTILNESEALLPQEVCEQDRVSYLPIKEKIKVMAPLLKYMAPLFFVYLAEYVINQGLYELLYYDTWLTQKEQYRWYQVDYQVGVFISRSSVMLFQIKKIYIPTLIQWVILVFFLVEAFVTFVPSIWITLCIIFLEGLCGGAVYVNAFTSISEEVSGSVKEFSLGAASMADSIGISIAGIIALPLHNALCSYKSAS